MRSLSRWFMAAALLLAPSPAYAQTAGSDTVDVAPPTGETDIDRASILAALEQVEPGGTIRFAPGTYLIGEIIHVTVPGISVVGHPDGTTLRGCHPDMFPQQGGMEEMFVAVVSCNGLDMAGGHQTVRGLIFEYAWHALVLGGMECIEGRGCVPVLQPVESRPGGYLVEDNTFRSTANGVRTLGQWSEPAVIRGNRFINTFHAVVVHGSVVHVLDNEISVPEPERVPSGHPGGAMFVNATDLNLEAVLLCAGNVIAGNRISGHPDGIAIRLSRAGVACRDNVIRENTITVERVKVPASWWGLTPTESDSSAVGVPIALINAPKADPEVFGSAAIDEQEGMLAGNLIEGNTVSGAEGIGIELLHASGNRIVNNTITGVARRDPFPGITVNSFDPQKSGWREANGSGIWISPGSDGNEILGNTFDDIASHAIVLEGDRNHVELQSAGDTVRDLGSNNRVVRPDGQTGSDALHPYESKFVDAGGLRMHYLDFGGAGLPILFTAGSRSAETWAGFAPRFTDRHRVLAITDRGVPPSEGEESGYARRAGDILALLDTLGIERAILVANSNPAQILIYLAEHHAERLAGLVFLAPDSEAGLESVEDPSGAMLMVERALLSAQDRDPDEAGNWDEEDLYRPRYLAADTATIAIPALTFVNMEGTRGLERSYYPLEVAALVASGALAIPDSTARTYFERLAADEAMQAEVRAAWDGTFVPVFRANEQAFFRAFGDRLRAVRLDVPPMNGVPVVTGYEYRDSPELIEPHIRRFLDEVKSTELTRQDSVVSWLAGRAIPIHGVAPGSGFEDLQPLKETLRDVRVIGLGEATHGTHEFFRFKHRLFEFMVREMGVRILAFEASQSAAENVVDPYVQGGPGDVESVVASLGLVGGWEEIRDLVAWMRAYNQSVAASERVQFVGFDIQYNDEARRIVLEYLRRVAPEHVARTEALFQVPVDSLVYAPYLSRDTAAARMAAEVAASALSGYRDLYEFVRANETRFATRTSRAEVEHLLRHIRVLDQFADAYGSLLAGSQAFNVLRDRYMADNIRSMLDAQPPDARVAVWAHNLHLMADSSLGNPRWMGRHLRDTYGPAYYALALGLGEGTFMACDIDADAQPYWALTRFESGHPREGTVDWHLTRAAERAGVSQFFLDLRGAPTSGVVGEWLSEPRGMFVVTSVYSPEWGARYASYPTSLAKLFDGVAFFRTTMVARPLPLGDCPDRIYR